MNIAQFKNAVKERYQKVGVAIGVALLTTPALADIDVSEAVNEIKGSKEKISAVAGASLGAYIGIRIWKLVRKAI